MIHASIAGKVLMLPYDRSHIYMCGLLEASRYYGVFIADTRSIVLYRNLLRILLASDRCALRRQKTVSAHLVK